MTDPWDGKPELMTLGDHFIYDTDEMDAWLVKVKAEFDLLEEHSGRWLHFVAVDMPEINESLTPERLMKLRERAEKWDSFRDSMREHGCKYSIICVELIEITNKLDSIRKLAETGLVVRSSEILRILDGETDE